MFLRVEYSTGILKFFFEEDLLFFVPFCKNEKYSIVIFEKDALPFKEMIPIPAKNRYGIEVSRGVLSDMLDFSVHIFHIFLPQKTKTKIYLSMCPMAFNYVLKLGTVIVFERGFSSDLLLPQNEQYLITLDILG